MPTEPQRVALITGAGSGIGRAAARLLAANGWRLALVGRREPALRETAAKLGGPSIIIASDVAEAAAARAAVRTSVGTFGRLDLLVNNAGVAPLKLIDQTTPDVLEQTFRTNALGPGNLIAEAWPVFKAQRSGCIVNVSTLGTIDPFPGFFAYAASKAAVNLMARSCANEGRAIGVRAFAVAPGAVETGMLRANFDTTAIPQAACLIPDDVARVILDCAEGRCDHENGNVIVVAR